MSVTRVYPKGGSWYYVEDLEERNPRTGRPKQKWHKLCRIDAGEAALHEALAALHSQPLDRGNMGARITAFREAHFKTLTFGVRKEYERMFDVIAEAFADFDDREVRPGDVLDFLNDNFADHLTARGHYKARLSTFFAWCVLKGFIAVNPCREVKLRRPPKRKGKMSAAVYWAMHDALPEAGRLFLELTYLTRQRPTEIRLLRESWIKPDRIRFEPSKTERSSGEHVEIVRSARINELLDRLRALRAERMRRRKVVSITEQQDAYLLVNEHGQPYTRSGLNTLWRRGREKAGHRQVTTRHIRPFALSEMERAGHPLAKIREAAAHTKTGQTEDYLNQHRERFSTVVITPPARPK